MDVKEVLFIGDAPELSADMTDEEIDEVCCNHMFVGVNNEQQDDERVLVNMHEQQPVLSHREAFYLALMMGKYVLHSPYAADVRPYHEAVSDVLGRPGDTKAH